MTTSRSSGSRQKITVIVFIVVVAIVGWQVYSLFRESTPPPSSSANQPATQASATTTPPSSPAASPPPHVTAAPSSAPVLPKPPLLSAKELELIKLQKQAEERYVAAINQLQMLKIERDIAETNKSIAEARLATATSEKEMATLSQSLGGFSQNLTAGPTPASLPSQPDISNIAAGGNFSVISVSYIQGRWSAVLSAQNKLYQIFVGDILPDFNNIKVLEINKSGVTLKIGDEERKISLVPLI